jgi:hypothetical protein
MIASNHPNHIYLVMDWPPAATTASESLRQNWQSTGANFARCAVMAPGEWNGNDNDRAFLMVGVPAYPYV